MKRTDKIKKKNQAVTKDLLQVIDNYLSKKLNLFFWIFFSASVLFMLLLFNMQVSVGGDDSNYIIRAYDFITDFKYPSFQGPLYPFVLGIFVGVFGVNLFVLKLLSVIFLSAHLYFFYIIFKKHIPPIILLSSIIVISLNSNLLFYGSQTYSEAFFLFVQVLFFLYFFKNFISNSDKPTSLKHELKQHINLALIILSLGLIKSIGFAALFAVLIYFALQQRWKSLLFSVLSFFASFGVWQIIKRLLWNDKGLQFSTQASSLFQKHPYDASQGSETFMGFLQRIVDNSNIYLSREFLYVMDLRPLMEEVNGQISATPLLPLLTLSIYALLIFAFLWNFRQNKYLMFTGIYLAMIMGITFVMLQTIWESSRLMMIFFPLLILFLFTGIYYLLKIKKLKVLQFVLPLLVALVFFNEFKATTNKINEHQKVFYRHLRGDITAGMTPDWRNYVNMCKWAAKNIDQNKKIACRKPGIAFVYTGRRFQGIYKVPTNNSDTLLNNLYENNVEYVIMASLRKIEARKTQYTINTIQRYLYYIQQKYPDRLFPIKQIGRDEPAYLFEIKKP